MLVARDDGRRRTLDRDLYGNELIAKPILIERALCALLTLMRERVLLLARDPEASRYFLSGLTKRDGPFARHPRIDEAPADGRIGGRWHRSRKPVLGLEHDPRCARHALDPTGDEHVAFSSANRLGSAGDRLEPRPTQAIHRLSRHFDRQASQQQRHARDVPRVLSSLIGAAEDDVI